MASIDLLDVSVWIALSSPTHVHHERAVKYWYAEAQSRVAFNSHTMLGLVRVMSNIAQYGGKPLSVELAWAVYREWRRDHAVAFLSEPSRCNSILDGLITSGFVGPRTWSDAYLAAFAEAGNLRLVSFDADFSRFPSLNWLHLQV